jgi:AAA domain
VLLTRTGAAPKRAVLFRTDTPFAKKAIWFVAPDGEFHKIEFLCDGQQVVVAGIHPDTKKPYTWHGGYEPGAIPRSDLPEVDEREAEEFMNFVADMLTEKFGFRRTEASSRGGNGHDTDTPPFVTRTDSVDVDAALVTIHYGNIDDTWVRVMGALLRKGVPANDVFWRLLDTTQRSPSCQNDPAKERWAMALADKMTRFLRDDPTFLPNLTTELQVNWHRAVSEGKKPKLVWRSDLGQFGQLQVRRAKGQDAPGDEAGKAHGPAGDPPKDETSRPKCRFKLVAFSDLHLGDDPLYLVDELVPRRGIVDLWGKPKCLKSFWAYDLAFHIAMGWEYRDRYVQQGAVVYCAFEGAHGYKKRREAIRRHYGIEEGAPIPLYLMPGQANLITEHALLIADISTQLGDVKPVAVFLDTLNKSLVGSENKDVDMGAYVRAAEAIRDAFDAVVVIVHHCGYDDTRPRGHSSLPAAVDAQLAVTRVENVVTVTVEMMRDGPEGTQVVSEVVPIEVGADRNGKILDSLVVIPSDAEAIASERRDWTRRLNVFYDAVKSALAAHGETFQPEAGVLPVNAVSLSFVRDRFYATYAEAEEDKKKKQDKLRQAFNRALGDAQKNGLIRIRHSESGQTMLWLHTRNPGQDG